MTTWYIRQSEIKKFKRCPRSWWLSYKRGGYGYELPPKVQSTSAGQRNVGTLVHECIELYYTPGHRWIDAIGAERARSIAEGYNTPAFEKDVLQLASLMVEGYADWIAENGHDVGERTLFVERQFEVPIGKILGDEVVITGRVDRGVQDTLSGEIIFEDTKTVQSLDQVGFQLDVDDQGQLYCTLGSKELGQRVNRFRHNMLRKVKRGPRSEPPYYGRHEVRFTEEQLNNAWTHTAVVLERMVRALQLIDENELAFHHRVAYPNPTKDCTWDCDFLAICPMMDRGEDWHGAISGLYVPRPPRIGAPE
jgi:RecB family exonuclease